MAQEKINASNKSTALLNFLGTHYQSAFHKDFKEAIIAESVTNAQPKTQLINCVLRKAYFDSDSCFTSKQLSVEIPYLEQLISSVIRHSICCHIHWFHSFGLLQNWMPGPTREVLKGKG